MKIVWVLKGLDVQEALAFKESLLIVNLLYYF